MFSVVSALSPLSTSRKASASGPSQARLRFLPSVHWHRECAPDAPAYEPPQVKCLECGCPSLVVRGHKVVHDPRGFVFHRPVAALTCDDCGKCYAVHEAWQKRFEWGTTGVSVSSRLS